MSLSGVISRGPDIDTVRSRFPALSRIQGGLPVAYFDGPGGTQVPRAVVAAMDEYLLGHNANTHWAYPTSAETDAAIAEARQALADFVHGAPEEIAFGANMTTLTFHLARALGTRWGAGDEIVVTELDHHANVDTWRRLERERGLTVRIASMDPGTGQIDRDAFDRAVTPRTKLIAIGGASNALGTINDLGFAADIARGRGALLFVDAVHSAPHRLTDVQAIGCDFLALSAYKFYGPHIGVLWTRREILEQLEISKIVPAPDTGPERLETGTQNHEGIVGAAAAVDFLASLAPDPATSRPEALREAFEFLETRGRKLFTRLWEGLGALPGVTLYGPPPDEPRTPTLSFTVAGRASRDVALALARDGLFLSHGDFYATTVIARLGLAAEGVVRAGCACYTSDEEVERLIEGVRALGR
ncbi:MAG: cysteine desulfurase-like protein [Acidobacteria bacterium]|nr:cysteine desulfurase-like protein [Acidobacteriota bacterium]MCA1609267.1 cysteine desulfurase-like protein [Acidobacteriota bacterium]